ncbi:MAG: CDP-alcohol phosphatidyltransferase family protein [Kofleriaceae bacterium]
MNLFAVRKQLDKVLHPVVATIARLPIHATLWTVIGAVLGAACGVALYYGYWWAGWALLLVRGLVDHIDGFRARNYNEKSTFGAIMDDVVDRWTLGVAFAGACIAIAPAYPHALIIMGAGITGALTNVIVKLSVYAEARHDLSQATGKTGHPIDVVGLFGSAEFILYFGTGLFVTAVAHDLRPVLAGCWAVAIMSHVSLLQRIHFAWKRYRQVTPTGAAVPASPEATTEVADIAP